MELRPHRLIKKKTREIKVGNLNVGGNSKICPVND